MSQDLHGAISNLGSETDFLNNSDKGSSNLEVAGVGHGFLGCRAHMYTPCLGIGGSSGGSTPSPVLFSSP